ncbi:MAG: efflux RND transporter periplasmic adaptor subunit [Bacteroidales bacterium]|nr:efflux RND transporter periplasmic adaptor subunit [Bacteroidota bacterium]MBL6949589.1 efflux RND transporter periplasmic adaptor subunit [Bacteroidales bacterium]
MKTEEKNKTKPRKKFRKKEILMIAVPLIAGLFFGWLFFHGSGGETSVSAIQTVHNHESEEATIWTCSMHPQIRMDHPGLCPICAMDLIPLENTSQDTELYGADEIQLSESAMKLADVQTIHVNRTYPDKQVLLLGKVTADERNITELTARFGGRIEKLFVNFTGQKVHKGEKLATIYSPDLVTAQRELLETLEYKLTNPEFYNATRNKLKLWDLTEEQITAIEELGEPQSFFDVLSPISGTVTMRHVALGDYVKEGSALFQVIDLTKVWIMFEAYESDLPWISLGDKITYTIQSIPGKQFKGRIDFIEPFINPKTRVSMVRIEQRNPGLKLKPGMFANGVITSRIAGNQKDLVIPKTAVLWTGKRAVVYVKSPGRDQPTFQYREITLGPAAGDFYVVAEGLNEGEEIAVNGVFKIDAAAQLAGKSSMMNMAQGANMEEVKIASPVVCGICKETIEKGLMKERGVKHVNVDLDTKLVTVTFNSSQISTGAIRRAISMLGYDADEVPADKSVYENLPACCKEQ